MSAENRGGWRSAVEKTAFHRGEKKKRQQDAGVTNAQANFYPRGTIRGRHLIVKRKKASCETYFKVCWKPLFFAETLFKMSNDLVDANFDGLASQGIACIFPNLGLV